MSIWRLLELYLMFLDVMALIIIATGHYDRIAVCGMKRFCLYLYPTAVSIAMLIIERPSEWSFDAYHMSHPRIGAIWIANGADGLKVKTELGDWVPSKIERRIIREAVDWRIYQYVHRRITLELRRIALGD